MFTIKKKRIATSFLFIGLAFLLVFLGVQPALALPVSPAQSITLDPNAGAPGSQVVVQGSNFSTQMTSCDARIRWDSATGPTIGSGTVHPNGTFATTATIPPNATAGAHTIHAEALYPCYGQASAAFNVSGNTLAAAYIYNTNLSKAQAFKTFLEGTAMLPTTLVKLSDVAAAATDFSPYDLIIIGPDTGRLSTWGNSGAIDRIRNSNLPILGLGEGGYAFFGKLNLHVGWPYGWHSTTATQARPVNLNHTIYQTPYDGSFPATTTLYTSGVGAVEIYLPTPPSDVLTLGRSTADDVHYSLVQQSGRYFLWGFDGGPAAMTTYSGQNLFVNVVWYLLLYRRDVDTLILTDYQRMDAINYLAANVNTLETKINTLVGLPKSQSNMVAVVKRMNLDTPGYVQTARTTWVTGTNDENVANTNAYVREIDNYIEVLKTGIYPNLQYLIFVGAHEVIPQKARPADDMDTPYRESEWAGGLPQLSGYFYELYDDTSGGATYGHYLTDSIYGDLSYINNGYGADNELIPELAVGRLVETPVQIGTLLDNYMASNAHLSNNNMASIASNDYMDGGQAAANHMGATADTSLIQSTFSASLIPPLIDAPSPHNEIVYLAGHGDYNYISPGYRAGDATGSGDTEALNNMPDAVIAASGCHNGVNLGNKRYHEYSPPGTTLYGDFPERFANKEVGVYLGSTGYTWISGSGSSTNPANTGWSEKLATHFLKHLLNDAGTTAGKAFKDAVNEYVSDYGGVGNPHRRVLAIATLYGIPNYHWPTLVVFVPWYEYRYFLVRRFEWLSPMVIPMGVQAMATAQEDVTLEITSWSVDPDGLINIPGASYTGDYDEPILPVIHASRVLPATATVVNVTWNQAESESTTIINDVPLASMAVLSDTIPNPFSSTAFYPSPPYYNTTVSALGGGGIEVSLNIVPAQYKQSTGQTRVWTKMVFELEYEVDEQALSADSDGDGLPDYWESAYGLSPNDASGDDGASGDPDQDGLTNAEEHDLGTDPKNPDTDHDGVSDGVEVDKGTDPLNPGSRSGDVYLPGVRR